MQLTHCALPLPRLPQATTLACNEANWYELQANVGNVRLMRHAQDAGTTCFALSGKLSDVCAALDALAAQEARNAWRKAM